MQGCKGTVAGASGYEGDFDSQFGLFMPHRSPWTLLPLAYDVKVEKGNLIHTYCAILRVNLPMLGNMSIRVNMRE